MVKSPRETSSSVVPVPVKWSPHQEPPDPCQCQGSCHVCWHRHNLPKLVSRCLHSLWLLEHPERIQDSSVQNCTMSCSHDCQSTHEGLQHHHTQCMDNRA